MSLSKRSLTIEPSITLKIANTAKRMKADGLDVIGFGVGEPDFNTPDYIADAGIQAIKEGKTRYTAASGISELKQAICKKLKEDNNLDYKESEIVVSCGAKHSIYNVMLALLDPGDEVLVPVPYWVSYPEQIRLADGVPVYVPTTDADSFKVTPQKLEAALTPKTKMIILTSPSNPTGMVYTETELKALASFAEKHNLFVVSDEIYEKLVYEDAIHISIAAMSDFMKSHTIVVNGVSKAYAMTGWRIGYIAAPEEISSACMRIQSHSTSNATTASQWASVAALEGPQEKINEMVSIFNERRKTMVQGLNQIPGLTCVEPKGAFYAFPNISKLFGKTTKSGKKITNSVELCEALLVDGLVACVPGAGFGADDYMRLSYAASMEDITNGIKRIRNWVETLI